NKGYKIKFFLFEKVAGCVGLLLIFLSMTIDAFLEPRIYLYRVPTSFHWGLFISGVIILIIIMGKILSNSLSASKQ
ncbi:MAG: hypothetical protein KAX20_04980, partial [Candidatus Omnitrophica bacterium]|nr:hypothetical protein [Candidatus Omnitrophota bacterium]